ncbi:MAG: sugar O-acetyltransferase [Flavobacteriaceae bacterium]|nr:sugar O-acetyltransferase [Bacteroidia bacterium]NNF76067.1 sugar O-acetyltransferase [Flavobacteriaceae bacterium]
MLNGDMYDPMDPELVAARHRARTLFQKINILTDNDKTKRDRLLNELVGSTGQDLWIEPPFYCDYGENIHLGKQVFMNFGCCILDVCRVTMGNNVMLGPNVQIYTATHPLEAKARNSGREFAKPISIGNNVWIGGNAVICPGITIGNNVVIGAGAVVTKSFPDDVFIGGNPAKVIKAIDN